VIIRPDKTSVSQHLLQRIYVYTHDKERHLAHKRMGYLRATYHLFKDTVSEKEKDLSNLEGE
jgi:hypothetical protein